MTRFEPEWKQLLCQLSHNHCLVRRYVHRFGLNEGTHCLVKRYLH